jgi:hypothetical protein
MVIPRAPFEVMNPESAVGLSETINVAGRRRRQQYATGFHRLGGCARPGSLRFDPTSIAAASMHWCGG